MENNKNLSNFTYNPQKIDILNIYDTKIITRIIIPIGWLYSLFTAFPIYRLINP
jgi:hypothetical protein